MIVPEFSRPIALDRIGLKEKQFQLTASPEECAALALRLGIPEVKLFTAEIRMKLVRGGKAVALKGAIRAELIQICVVTLEPVATSVAEEFTRLFSTETEEDKLEVVIDLHEEDPPEPVINGQIDMGEAAAEHLALAMDPFPRAADAEFAPPPELLVEEPVSVKPFELLAEHRKKK